MLTAFLLLNTKTGSEADVLRELKKIESIKDVTLVYGAYDIVLRVESNSINELKQTITWKIRKIDYVTETQTMILA